MLGQWEVERMKDNRQWHDPGHIDHWEDMTPTERQHEKSRSLSGNDWYKLLLVFVAIYYALKILAGIAG
ncbi:MAG: hypothetical protein IJ602_06380 [Paludibacteraceae bacterium]|nr:hypothetical protein [Paludibacteraceae bacterium]